MKRATLLAAGALLLAGFGFSGVANAQEVSYNIGWASEYYYRGLLQKESSGSAGIDFANGGFYAGGWTADVGDGLEVDGYFGYGVETDAGFSLGVGLRVLLTPRLDDTYEELNLNSATACWESNTPSAPTAISTGRNRTHFLAATMSADNGLYGTIGQFGGDFDGNYIEIGYGLTVSEIDFGVAAIFSSDEFGAGNGQFDANGNPDASQAVIFTIGKAF